MATHPSVTQRSRLSGAAIRTGEIIAVKGIGGFHLVCDATNDDAIEKLRERKGRVEKPLAVMVRDVQSLRVIRRR